MIESFILKDLTTEREILFDQNGSYLLNANKTISLILPPISTQDSLYKTRGQIGKILAHKSIDTRPIIITAHTWALNEDELNFNKSILNSFINPLHEFSITFPNYRYLIFTPDSTIRYVETITDNNSLFCKFVISGLLYDPLLYDENQTTIRAKYLTSNFALPLSFSVADPFTFSGLTNSSTIDVINYGDLDVGMIFEITSSSESINFEITNLETQEFIRINTTIVSGDLIIIDTRINHRSIKKYNSGVITNYYKYLDSDSSWLTLKTGINTFSLSADSGDAALGCSIKYRNAYYGVEQTGTITPPVVIKKDVSGVTAKTGDVLSGIIFVDEDGEQIGSMPNRGSVFGEATSEVPFVIPQGFHNGLGTVSAIGGGGDGNVNNEIGEIITTVLDSFTINDLPFTPKILSWSFAVEGTSYSFVTEYIVNEWLTSFSMGGTLIWQNSAMSSFISSSEGTITVNVPDSMPIGTEVSYSAWGYTGSTDENLSSITATANKILYGEIGVNEFGEEVTGTMPNRGAVTGEASSETPYAIQEGYHNGSGVVTAAGGGGADLANAIACLERSSNNLTLPNGITIIPKQAFYQFATLASMVFPDSVSAIGESAFNGCTNLANTALGNGITTIEIRAFISCAKLAITSFASCLTTIRDFAFNSCTSLINITLPDNLTSIGINVFEGCSKLTSVIIGSGITVLSNYAFGSCTSLVSVALPITLTTFGYASFQACTGLRKIWIPISCTTIYGYNYSVAPFSLCSSLLVIYCEAASKPAGWETYWDNRTSSLKHTVNWGVTKEAYDAL